MVGKEPPELLPWLKVLKHYVLGMFVSLENGFSIIMSSSYFSALFSTHQSIASVYFETRNMP